MACEVKWLKQAKAEEIVRDIWKLMLSRSVSQHGASLRCYLLVGGENDAFINAMNTLRKNVISLNWRDGSEATTEISLNALAKKQTGAAALRKLLSWNQNKNYRTPPACFKKVKCTRRAVWYRTLDGTKWRMGLWELKAWGLDGTTIDWTVHKAKLAP
jgi:hypothetical protein